MAAAFSQPATADTLKNWLALYHAPGVGDVAFHRLLALIDGGPQPRTRGGQKVYHLADFGPITGPGLEHAQLDLRIVGGKDRPAHRHR